MIMHELFSKTHGRGGSRIFGRGGGGTLSLAAYNHAVNKVLANVVAVWAPQIFGKWSGKFAV